MDFRFTNEYSFSKLDEVVSFLFGPRLWIPQVDYPDFFEWADRSHQELRKGVKRAMVVLSQGNVVGVTIYQKHKNLSDTLEIKNLTVRPDVRGRHIASFLLRNTELEGIAEFRSQYAICDAKRNNWPIKFFLFKHQYKIVGQDDLYSLKTGKDSIYKKKLNYLVSSGV